VSADHVPNENMKQICRIFLVT